MFLEYCVFFKFPINLLQAAAVLLYLDIILERHHEKILFHLNKHAGVDGIMGMFSPIRTPH